MSDLSWLGDEIPRAHKHLKQRRARKIGSGGGEDAAVEVEADTANEEAIERSNELAARVGTVESKLDALTASMDELHSDVRRLLAQQQQGASVQEEKPPAPMTRRRRKPSSRASAASACSSGPEDEPTEPQSGPTWILR